MTTSVQATPHGDSQITAENLSVEVGDISFTYRRFGDSQTDALPLVMLQHVDVDGRVQAFLDGPTRGWFNPVYTKAHRKGGHFVPWENPDAVIEDVRATFRGLRRQ